MTSAGSEPMPQDLPRPPDLLAMGDTAPQSACPYLGFYFDREARADFAWEAHRCWRADAPILVALAWQEETCLTCACVSCPRVQYPAAQVPPPSAAPLEPVYVGIRRYRALLLVLALLLLLAVVGVALSITGREAVSPSLSALFSPSPRRIPTGTATDVPALPVVSRPTVIGVLATSTPILPTSTPGQRATSTLAQVGATPLTGQSTVTRSPIPPSAAILTQRVAGVEAAVRTGQLDVVADYGDGRRVLYSARFDLRTAGGLQYLAFKSVYEGQTGSRTAERVTIGEQTWDREDDGGWLLGTTLETPRAQIEPFLPRIGAIAGPVISDPAAGTLRWYDPVRDADFLLKVDPKSSIPQQLVWRARSTSLVVTIQYSNWNGPVDIRPPAP
jgi:hypothetical protein